MSIPLEPDASTRARLTEQVAEFIEEWFAQTPSMDASAPGLSDEQVASLLSAPGADGRPLADILADLEMAGQGGILHPSGGHMSYIPNGGLFTSALAEHLAAALNRYTGVTAAAPGMTAIETGVTRWIASIFGFEEPASCILLSGGSTANLTGIVAARVDRLGERFDDGTLYLTRHTHHSVAKAARIAGFRNDQIRLVDVNAGLEMDLEHLRHLVSQDAAAGLRPFLVAPSAGTTDTGTVDDLSAVADVADEHGLWMHTDAAYGGFFYLTGRGRDTLGGIERSDSIALDPHKGLSIPFGVGALVVADEKHLIDANYGRGAYLQHEEVYQGLRDISTLGPELTRPFRGLGVWLPLQLHGVEPFREALDASLDLAAHAYERIRHLEGVRPLWAPDLSIVAFGFEDDDVGRRALEAVNDDRSTHLSPTEIDGRFILRLAILNRRTTAEDVDHAIDLIEKTLIG